MRILLINQYAGSPRMGMEFRPHWMATEWKKSGHEVLIVAADWSHLRREQPSVKYGRTAIEGIPFLILPVTRHSGNGPARLANMFTFVSGLWAQAPRLGRARPDVVIASSTHPLDVRPAASIARSSGARLVHEIHDLWPLTPMLLGGLKPSHPMIRLMQTEEDFACRNADVVISMLPATKDYLVSRGLDPTRWAHVSNGVPASAIGNATHTRPRPGDHPFRIGYFGSHGTANALDALVQAARLFPECEFHLYGSGPNKQTLVRDAGSASNVFFHDPVEPEDARRQMSSMDALYMGAPRSPLYSHGISLNKMFDYMAAGRPIVSAVDAPLNPAVEAGAAVQCRPEDPYEIATTLRELSRRPNSELNEMGRNGQNWVRETATHEVLAARFLREATRRDQRSTCV